MCTEVPACDRFAAFWMEITKPATADFEGNMVIFRK